MEAYATVPPDDPFAASKGMFAALADELAGPAAAGLTAFELEELVDEESRKAVRQLVQDHYDLRALREEQQARQHAGPVPGSDERGTRAPPVGGRGNSAPAGGGPPSPPSPPPPPPPPGRTPCPPPGGAGGGPGPPARAKTPGEGGGRGPPGAPPPI